VYEGDAPGTSLGTLQISVPYGYATPAAACSSINYSTTLNNGVTVTETFTFVGHYYNVINGFGLGDFYCDELDTYTGAQVGTYYYPDNLVMEEAPLQSIPGEVTSCPGYYYVVATAPPEAETCSADCVADPINPGIGNVYKAEEDVAIAIAGAVAFRRFYNSADPIGADQVPGWRHSYDQSIQALYQPQTAIYPGSSSTVSQQYATPDEACTTGFTDIRNSVPAWVGANASYSSGVCMISGGNSSGGTLPILLSIANGAPPSTTPTEYDVIREDGQTLRYPVQNGGIMQPPGISLRLAVTSSGYTLTDDDDRVETYSSAGVLQSIVSRAGVVQTISYDGQGLFSGVTDSFGMH
jgi:YD repeat-containing protein